MRATARSHALTIVRVHRVEPRALAPQEVLAAAAPDRLIRRADIDDLTRGGVFQPEDFADALGHFAEAVLAFPERLDARVRARSRLHSR